MSRIKQFLKKYRRSLSWITGVLTTYTLLGFFFVPWITQQQIVKLLDERLQLNAQFESIYFNPYSFYVEIQGLDVSERDGSDLLLLNNAHINFQASRLATLKFQFSQAIIDGLDVYINRSSPTENNLADLVQRWGASAAPAEEPQVVTDESEGELPPLEVLSLQLSDLNIHLLDEVPDTPFTTTVNLTSAIIEDISTLQNQTANNTLVVYLEQDAVLSWSGGFTLNPMDFNGTIVLENFNISAISRYLQNTIPVTIDQGRFGASFNYSINLAEVTPQIGIDNIAVTLSEIQVQQSSGNVELLAVTEIGLNGGQVLLPDNRLQFESLVLNDAVLNLLRDSQGELNLLQLVDEFSASSGDGQSSSADDEPTSGQPWSIALENFAIENTRIAIADQSLEQPFSINTLLNVSATGINNQPEASIDLSMNLALDTGGEISSAGTIQVLPEINLAASLTIDDLSLVPLQPYLNEFAFIELQSGAVNLTADVNVNPEEPFSYRGGFTLQSVEVTDQQLNEALLTLDRLDIDSVNYSMADNQVDISEVLIDSLFARVIVNQDGTTNVVRSIKPLPEEEPAPLINDIDEVESSSGIAVSVGRVQIDNASSSYTDENLPIVFNANIQGLSGAVEGFSTNSTQPMELVLEGQVGEFGLVQIDSVLNPFDIAQESEVNLVFTNLDMPSMTPYVIKFAGREIADGRVDVNLAYNIVAGELQANNQVVLYDLRLGERVEYPDAMDLPLDLATALLKDRNGVIDLQVPITGNINEPQFSFGPAIRQAISNILINIVSAPFRLLGNLIGGDSDDLDSIRFLPGRSDIASPERETLTQLHAALLQRPQLLLQIPPVSGEADIPALQTAAVRARIDNLIEQGDPAISIIERRLAAAESLYNQAGLTPVSQQLRLLHSSGGNSDAVPGAASDSNAPSAVASDAINQGVGSGAAPGVAGNEALELDTLAYISDLRDRLINAEEIPQSVLASLAQTRMSGVVDFIAALGDIDRVRLVGTEAISSELDEDGWLTMTFDLSTL